MPSLRGRQLTLVQILLAVAIVAMVVGIVLSVIGDAPLLALAGAFFLSATVVMARLSWRERHQRTTD